MRRLRVWAPAAGRVEVEFAHARHAMRRGPGGWWFLAEDVAEPEAEYAYVLDDAPALPDPRAPRLPHGVESPGRLVDFTRFAWSDSSWQPPPLASGILYEIHVGTFTRAGTFDGAIERLPDLVDLGVTHALLMPVHSFPGDRGWGYDGVGLFAPHEPYGGPYGLARFVDAAHAQGIAVILDVVYNHLGPSGNHLARFGPYFSDRHRTPWGDAINLDGPGSDEVRRFLCDNALQWLRDYHIDGLRLDAVHALFDQSALPFLAQLRDEVDALAAATGRHKFLIAESDLNDPRVVMPREAGGYGLDAQWNDDFHHALHAWLTGEQHGYYADFGRLADLAKAIESAFVYDGRYSVHRGRRHGTAPRGIPGHRFIVCLQNHDQVGNRPLGERSAQLLDADALQLAATLVLLSPFVPQLFQGEEWGAQTPFLYFTSHTDVELARAIAAGRRAEFASRSPALDPQDAASFALSRLDWSERERDPHARLLDWHRRLIRLRKEWPELCDSRLERVRVRFDEAEAWLVIERGWLRIVCHRGTGMCCVPLGELARADLLLGSHPSIRLGCDGVEMPPDSVAVLLAETSEEKPSWTS